MKATKIKPSLSNEVEATTSTPKKKKKRTEYRQRKKRGPEGNGCRVKIPDSSEKGFHRCGCKAWFLSPKGLRVCGTHRNKIETRYKKKGTPVCCRFVGPEKISPEGKGDEGK